MMGFGTAGEAFLRESCARFSDTRITPGGVGAQRMILAESVGFEDHKSPPLPRLFRNRSESFRRWTRRDGADGARSTTIRETPEITIRPHFFGQIITASAVRLIR
jgi:hypothetical protein